VIKNIFRFEISVKEPIFVKISQCLCNFIKDVFDLPFSQGSLGLLCSDIDLIKVRLYEIEYKKKFVIGENDLLEFYNIGVI
jgi:hypothetical protein